MHLLTRGKLLYGFDIAVLQETRLVDSVVAGFQCFYNRQHLGQVILVRNHFVVSEVDMSKWDTEAMQVHAVRGQSPCPLVIMNVYGCNGKVDAQEWRTLFGLDEENIIFCGDFNARGTQWGNTITNKQGKDLEDALVSADLVCLNDGRVTRMATRPGDTDSVIDLALVSTTLASVCK